MTQVPVNAVNLRTSDIYDEREEEVASLGIPLENIGGNRYFHGPVRTLRCFQDNGLLKQIIAEPGDGAVLVIDGGGSLDSELLGGSMAATLTANGWAGVVVYGAVRDRAELAELPLGVKALGSNPRKSGKDGTGERDVTVTIGQVDFQPGAMIYADDDGILVERESVNNLFGRDGLM